MLAPSRVCWAMLQNNTRAIEEAEMLLIGFQDGIETLVEINGTLIALGVQLK